MSSPLTNDARDSYGNVITNESHTRNKVLIINRHHMCGSKFLYLMNIASNDVTIPSLYLHFYIKLRFWELALHNGTKLKNLI